MSDRKPPNEHNDLTESFCSDISDVTLPTEDDDRPEDASLPEIPGFKIMRRLSRGGQGIVYLAIDPALGRKVAIKFLRPDHGGSDIARKRFEKEAKLLAQLKHENLVEIHALGATDDGNPYYVMEFINGQPLDAYLREKRPTISVVLSIFIQICDALDLVHGKGIVHRDVKPANILIDVKGTPRIVDFGLAEILAGPYLPESNEQILGTIPYMAPEQLRPAIDEVSPETDVYALGVVLYQTLTGSFPYPRTQNPIEIMDHILHTPPSPIQHDTVPGPCVAERQLAWEERQELNHIFQKALQKERKKRYPRAGLFLADLHKSLTGGPIRDVKSFAYQSSVRFRKAVQKYCRLSHVVAIVTSTIFGWAAGHALSRYTSLPTVWRNYAFNLVDPAPVTPFQHVVVAGLGENTDIDELARQEGLVNVSRQVLQSWRALHGRLIRRLVDAGCRTVVMDIKFMGESPFDSELVDGVNAMRQAGGNVVIMTPNWREANDRGLPLEISPPIAEVCRWGCGKGDIKDSPPYIELVASQVTAEPRASLALAAYCAFRQPSSMPTIIPDWSTQTLSFEYWKHDAQLAEGRRRVGKGSIPLSTVRSAGQLNNVPLGLSPEDLLGLYYYSIPKNDVLRLSTIDYGEWFQNEAKHRLPDVREKIVLIGNLLQDIHHCFDGRSLPGCYAQASAIDALLRREIIRAPSTIASTVALPFGGSLVGMCIGMITCARRWRWLWVLVAIALFYACSLGSLGLFRFIINPLYPVASLVAASECVALIKGRQRARVNLGGNNQ